MVGLKFAQWRPGALQFYRLRSYDQPESGDVRRRMDKSPNQKLCSTKLRPTIHACHRVQFDNAIGDYNYGRYSKGSDDSDRSRLRP